MPVMQFMFILLLLSALGLFCAWEQSRVTELGYRAQQLRREHEDLLQKQRELLWETSLLRRPQRIAGEVNRLDLGLVEAARLTPVRPAAGDPPKTHRSPALAHRDRR